MTGQQSRHSVSVSGVITGGHGHALLIQRRDNGRWEPPGGVLALAESIEDGLRREVREETGPGIEPGTLSGVYKNMAHRSSAATTARTCCSSSAARSSALPN